MAKPTVLLIDDDPGFVSSLSLVLEKDFRVYKAPDGRKGLSIIEKHPLSLILLDLNMPKMSGVETLTRIRILDPSVKVLILTGVRRYEWAVKCADLNVQGFLEKPFDPEELISKMKKLLCMEELDSLKAILGEGCEERIARLSNSVKGALEFISRKYKKKFKRKEIAECLNITPGHLSEKFHQETGMPLLDFINIYRINKSKAYLTNSGNSTIKEIAFSVGIPDCSYFCKLFKKYVGLTPIEFRKKHSISYGSRK